MLEWSVSYSDMYNYTALYFNKINLLKHEYVAEQHKINSDLRDNSPYSRLFASLQVEAVHKVPCLAEYQTIFIMKIVPDKTRAVQVCIHSFAGLFHSAPGVVHSQVIWKWYKLPRWFLL